MSEKRVFEKQLENGLTVLVCPKSDAAKVSIQLWYNVGSKHEESGEKGIAHFIEHMIFKGTSKLTESDINLITHKLSGYCNAFTSYDYTGYLFDIPVANWDKVLPIMADCMENCTFKQEHLNSEVKAVIQELKMYKDNYASSLAEQMVTTIFQAHPYHHPIIGYKQDLWSVSRERLIDFYKKHYTPNNAALVVVGDVNPDEVYAKAQDAFGAISAGPARGHDDFFINDDIVSKSVALFRDIKQPIGTAVFALPGIKEKNEFLLDMLTYVLANGRGSRLYKKIVHELQLAVSIQAYVYDLFDKALLFVQFHPKQEKDIDAIIDVIQKEIDTIAQNGLLSEEVERAQRLTQIACQHMLEDTQQQAYAIGKSFMATQDANYPFSFAQIDIKSLQDGIEELIQGYCKSTVCHTGRVVAIPKESLDYWKALQKKSDDEDAKILQEKARDALVEDGVYVHGVELNEKKISVQAAPKMFVLPNGLEVLWLHNDEVDIVECFVDYKAKYTYDPDDLQGIGTCVSSMMLEGTKNLPGQKFAEAVEEYGMSISASPGQISTTFLHQDLEKGLGFIADMLQNATLEEKSLQKVKEKMQIQLRQFWDTPTSFGTQLAREIVYKNHPKSKMSLGTESSLAAISLEDCRKYYDGMISPHQARLVLVGSLAQYDVEELVKKQFAAWSGDVISDIVCPKLFPLQQKEITSYMNRDQVVLVFAGLSLDRLHPDYDKIVLFDQIFTGGVLRSMSSKLFQLREQSGLFYTIGGSLLYAAGKEPGMVMIKTIVSGDRIEEAENAISCEIDRAIDTVTEEELQEAKNALINSFDLLYESNEDKAATILFLRKYNLPFDYFAKRVETLQNLSLQEVKLAVKELVKSDKLVRIKIGRV